LVLRCLSFTEQSRTDRAGKTKQSETAARWPRSRIALQTALDVFRCFAKLYGLVGCFLDILQVATGFGFFSGLWMLFGVLFRCFAKQDRLMDVCTNRKAPAEDPRESSCSQGTTTKSGGDVCGRVK
jgi:hypothetical protein